ncbi:hypothetical protein [Photorhabdus luminescens]|uniref:hypothetical protein n=1 Tax=Photorhabdus luminescens TaxID=29488 RepID=UPI0011322AD9|nr:hypothetical protein [Photorhabdus luminescens]MCW7762683.1 hypothetical protein [Photorhabdus luminescens subsp. venezuelensis]
MPISDLAKKIETRAGKDKTGENIETGNHLEITLSSGSSKSKDTSKPKRYNISAVKLIYPMDFKMHRDGKGANPREHRELCDRGE